MTENNYKLAGTPKEGMLGATIGFFIGFAAVVALGATSKEFSGSLSLNASQVALLGAMPNLSGSLLRIPFSAWSDQNGGRKPLLSLLFMSIIGMIGLYFLGLQLEAGTLTFSSYYVLLFFGFLAGCGIATFSVGISQVSYWFPQRDQGKALGTYAGVGNLAPGIFSLIMAVTLVTLGVSGSYMLWLILLIIGTGLYYILGKNAWYFQLTAQGVDSEEAERVAGEHGQEIFPKYSLVNSLKASAAKWQTWALVGLYFTSFGGFIGLATWFKKYWTDLYNPAPIVITDEIKFGMPLILNGIFIIVGSVVRVYTGPFADKIGGTKTLNFGISILGVGSLIMTFVTDNYFLSIAGMIIIGFGMGVMNAAVFKLVPKAVPDAVGGTSGWVGGLGAFGGFVIPPILGIFVDMFETVGYGYGYVVFIILTLLCFLFTWLISNSTEK